MASEMASGIIENRFHPVFSNAIDERSSYEGGYGGVFSCTVIGTFTVFRAS